MDKVFLKIEELKKEGHKIFAYTETQIWYNHKDHPNHLRCIYLKSKQCKINSHA